MLLGKGRLGRYRRMKLANNPGGCTNYEALGLNVFGNHTACSYHGVYPNLHAQ